jgi:hypothetical protein
MPNTAQRIREIAERLDPDRQQVLLEVAEGMAVPSRFFDAMNEAQRQELDRAIAEADRGEGIDQSALDERLDALLARRDA